MKLNSSPFLTSPDLHSTLLMIITWTLHSLPSRGQLPYYSYLDNAIPLLYYPKDSKVGVPLIPYRGSCAILMQIANLSFVHDPSSALRHCTWCNSNCGLHNWTKLKSSIRNKSYLDQIGGLSAAIHNPKRDRAIYMAVHSSPSLLHLGPNRCCAKFSVHLKKVQSSGKTWWKNIFQLEPLKIK